MDSDIIIVSGLPRSGTSMMMGMLQAGGVSLLIDDKRPPDDDNPRGYFEYAPVRRLLKDASWMGDAQGKALKVICYFLPVLPAAFNYKVIYMVRPAGEVISSQRDMLRRAGKPHDDGDMELLCGAFEKSEQLARDWMADSPNVKGHVQAHHDVLENPLACANALEQFLERPLDTEAMASAVDKTLYRQRGGCG